MLSELMRCSMDDVLKTHHDGDPLPMSRAVRYATHFAQGMNYLHLCKPPIIHRDLKPANLLLDFSDTLKAPLPLTPSPHPATLPPTNPPLPSVITSLLVPISCD